MLINADAVHDPILDKMELTNKRKIEQTEKIKVRERFQFKMSRIDVEAAEIKRFIVSIGKTYSLMTTRFTDATWIEYVKSECKRYNLSVLIAKAIPIDETCIVIEMNNTRNRIMGLGFVKNYIRPQKIFVHDNHNYNRYNYRCERRISREQMTTEEDALMCRLEWHCFYGKTNLKRPPGITQFPVWFLYAIYTEFGIDVMQLIADMFNNRVAVSK